MTTPSTILWFRNDLRLDDHPALRWAIGRGAPVIPVFIWSPAEEGDWSPGSASRVWLRDSLEALDAQLRRASSRLVLRCGSTLKCLKLLIEETSADCVCWTRRYEPAVLQRDAAIKKALKEQSLVAESFNGSPSKTRWCTD
jgi:deoxyribodipyrimidine photo-lyase